MLKAVLFDFNGIVINDEAIHSELFDQLLLAENLRPIANASRSLCVGRSDRSALIDLFTQRGRVLSAADLDRLLAQKAAAYRDRLAAMPELPLYPINDFLLKCRLAGLKLGLVSGALRLEIETVLERAKLQDSFSVIVAGDEITTSKPDPTGYLEAITHLNALEPDLNLKPDECLAIEDSFAGIEAAKRAGIPVVGVANTYPQHMLLRLANWAVDDLMELEFERVLRVFTGRERTVAAPQVVAVEGAGL